MADCSGLLQQGIGAARLAAESDAAGDYESALRHYQHALECFLSVLRLETNDRITQTLRPKVRAYMARAERLKEIVDGVSAAPSVAAEPPQSPLSVSLPAPNAAHPPVLLFPSPPKDPPSRQPPVSLLFPSSPVSAAVSPPKKSPSPPQPPPQPQRRQPSHREVRIAFGQKGCSYEALFGELCDGVSHATVEDPYVRSKHQIGNFLRLCELFVKRSGVGNGGVSVELTTTRDPNPVRSREQEAELHEIAESMAAHGSSLAVRFSDTLHDRQIALSNGVTIKLGRGLDFYQPPPPNSSLWLGRHDWDLRPCLETTIDIFTDDDATSVAPV